MTQSIAILTNFQEFNPGYSLVGIVVDQINMLAKYGHTVHLFVNEQFNPKYNYQVGLDELLDNYQDRIHLHKKTKFMHLTDYQSATLLSTKHEQEAKECGATYACIFKEFNIEVVFTHDFVFTGWSLPYAVAVKSASNILQESGICPRWFHWIHSVPSGHRDWWYVESYGQNHKLVFPNRTEIARVSESFATSPNNVVVIPHIKDPRSWFDFHPDTREFIDAYPHIMEADVIQIYPVSTDRMSAKQLNIVIRLFGEMKKAQQKVVLIAANQWATGRQCRESVEDVIKFAASQGLGYGKEFIFTSEYVDDDEFYALIMSSSGPDELAKLLPGVTASDETFEEVRAGELEKMKPWCRGIPRRMLRELQLLSNLMVFPTVEESFGLVGPESAAAGVLVISNRSLAMMSEVLGVCAPSFEFGSHHQNHSRKDDPTYYQAVAMAILNRLYSNEALMTKTHCRKRYNMDSLYHNVYLPFCL